MSLEMIKILQIGPSDLSKDLEIPDFIEWNYINEIEKDLEDIDLFLLIEILQRMNFKLFFR